MFYLSGFRFRMDNPFEFRKKELSPYDTGYRDGYKSGYAEAQKEAEAQKKYLERKEE